ncbi:DUF6752 domain-containing protein [Blastococcus sp. SYSU DS0973]
MTDAHHPGRRSPIAGPVRMVRRVLAPAALELEGELHELRAQRGELERVRAEADHLRRQNEELQAGLADAQRRLAAVEEHVRGAEGAPGGLAAEVAELNRALLQERRLHLRVAEIADLVTELVLPLHDRAIDPDVLRRLRPDTL